MAIQDELDSPLARVCKALGGQSALARLIGKDQSTIHDRLRANRPIWAEHVLAIETATGISKHELRPDIYPLEILASQPSPIPEGRTTVCNPAETDPSTAEPLADGGDAARSMSCDHLDRAADAPPIGKAAA